MLLVSTLLAPKYSTTCFRIFSIAFLVQASASAFSSSPSLTHASPWKKFHRASLIHMFASTVLVCVAEKHLHNLVQAFCVQSPPEHQRLVPRLQINFKTFRDFHVLHMPPLFLRCVCSYRNLAESLPPSFAIQHSALRSLVCPFPSSPCNTTGVRSTQRRPCPTLLQQIPWHLFSHFRPSCELSHATPAIRVRYFPCTTSPSS